MKTKLIGLFCFLMTALQISSFASASITVNENLKKAFTAAFPRAQTVDWQEHGEFYSVHFKENAVLMEIEYDHEGNFVQSEKYYRDADMLPLHLAWEITKEYKGKIIYGIVETNTDDQTYYYVKLQDDKEWITLKGTANGIQEVVERFDKQH